MGGLHFIESTSFNLSAASAAQAPPTGAQKNEQREREPSKKRCPLLTNPSSMRCPTHLGGRHLDAALNKEELAAKLVDCSRRAGKASIKAR